MMTRTIAALLFVTASLSAQALAPVQPETLDTYSRAGKIITYEMPYKHLNHASFEDQIATNALNRFISLLDFDRTYFLASDIESFQAQATNLDERLKSGDLSMAFDIYEVFMGRASNRIDFVDSILDAGFDLDKEESYNWRRKDLPWAASEEEWNDLWRRKVKNQYVARVVAEQLAEEKKAREKAEKEVASEDVMEGIAKVDKDGAGNQVQVHIPGEGEMRPPVESESETATDVENEDALVSDVESDAVTEGDFATDGDTESEAATEEENNAEVILPAPKLTPEEAIRKEYRQYLSVLNDNDAHWLLPLYISSFVHAYDPHSDYMSQNSTEDFDISMKLSLVGIGALLSSEDGAAKIVRIIPGGPAEKDGRLQPGDKIVAVGQGDEEPVDILHWPLSKSVRKIRGEKNTRVVLHVIPASDISGSTIKVVDLIRDEVKLEEGAAKGRVTSVTNAQGRAYPIGIISIPDFYADINARNDREARSVTRDVQNILYDLATNQIEGLILDLRNNGGGSLTEAVELTGLFIDSGPVVQVKTEERVITLPDSDPTIAYAGPLLVLVNRQSASASEIFAGALQDYGRALIVGDSKTHGKGTVQTLFPLRTYNPKLGSLKLTTASYYRIAGGSTQKKGITPDLIIPSVLDSMEIGEEYLPGALEWTVVDPAIYRHAFALKELIAELGGRSAKRRTEEPRFIAYEQLLTYLAEQRQSKTISLRLEDRLPMARRENEMSDFIVESTANDDLDYAEEEQKEDPGEKNAEAPPKNDLILDEALNIIQDIIDLQNETPADSPEPELNIEPDTLTADVP